MVYLCDVIQFSNKKELTIGTHYNIDESPKYKEYNYMIPVLQNSEKY